MNKTDITGIFKPTLLNATFFCGSLLKGCYFKGKLNNESYNGEFTNTVHFYNITINGVIFGTINAYANIIKLKETHIPKDYETGNYDFYKGLEDEDDDDYNDDEYEEDTEDEDENYIDNKYKNENIEYNYETRLLLN